MDDSVRLCSLSVHENRDRAEDLIDGEVGTRLGVFVVGAAGGVLAVSSLSLFLTVGALLDEDEDAPQPLATLPLMLTNPLRNPSLASDEKDGRRLMSRLRRWRAFLNLLDVEKVEEDEEATPGMSATSVSCEVGLRTGELLAEPLGVF